MVLHPAEDIVIDVAEEMNFGFYTPVVARVGECRVFKEEPAVPAAHLVIGDLRHILHALLSEYCDGFLEEVHVYPAGDFPVFFGYDLCAL